MQIQQHNSRHRVRSPLRGHSLDLTPRAISSSNSLSDTEGTNILTVLLVLQEAECKEAEAERQQLELQAKRDAEEVPSRQLAGAIMARGVRVCRPQVRLESR